MFGRHSTTSVDERPVNGTEVDDRTGVITRDDTDGDTERVAARPNSMDKRRVNEVDEPRDETKPAIDDKTTDEVETPAGWAHVSFTATLSVVAGTLAIVATLTGLLAPLGFAAGVVAVILGLISVASVGRPHVTGHSLVLTGLALGVVAIVLSLLAINGQLSWLSSKTDEIAVVHNWLNDHMHWLRRW
jgi:hypothetical protein